MKRTGGMKMNEQFKQELAGFIHGHVCILGIGDRKLHDDGVGSLLAAVLQNGQGYDSVDAGCAPENFLETVARRKPGTILMVHATDFNGEAGEARLIFPEKVHYSNLSRHAGSLRMLAEHLQTLTRARIALLAIQPANTEAGQGLSLRVSRTFSELLEFLPRICGDHDALSPDGSDTDSAPGPH